jgi:hypothetical protein
MGVMNLMIVKMENPITVTEVVMAILAIAMVGMATVAVATVVENNGKGK